jgi:lipoate-protein ligase A
MLACRLIVDGPAHGSWNMAVDEALLESATMEPDATLRLYQWAPATLSLGYFQPHADTGQHAPSRGCPIVRRRSGGGAIVHDAEITYALILPLVHPAARNPLALYFSVHESIIQVLQRWGLTADLYGEQPIGEPFLCFHRRSQGDVLVDGHKVLGSAQRRARSVVLQHGSLLLHRSQFAPSLLGVRDLGGLGVEYDAAVAELAEAILGRLRMEPREGKLTPQEVSATRRLAAARFEADHWTRKR